ncbi:MAG: ATP-dependent DNA helicase RecG [Candidatus Daviesbacteria bacterium GW2011_GWA2_42_7]|uniref:ATP-dependent DNA helicase RecG n=1 Tax=Candidatus Daviesbacteria bacterium GW2011_GWA2_42_7 TaxID=1618425 RepID=A0A0G1E671_9BACT|nr:MAG: ATP-dependent DNA helicase RecG [Candidatus Daviesbacteria bacterium GW2011_GWA2_42_7]
MELKTPLLSLSGIGPSLADRLHRLNLFTVEDLVYHFPFRYDDFSATQPLDQTRIGETATFRGELWSIKNTYTRFRKVLTQAILNDGTGTVEIVWFNQPWLTKNLKAGDRLQVSGKLNRKGSKISLVSPVWERIQTPEVENFKPRELGIHTGRLVPVYPETYGLTSKWLRYKISQILPTVLPKITDPLPEDIKDNMLPEAQALQQIHFPDNFGQVRKATERLAFDELFYIHLQTQMKKADWKEKKVVVPWKINQSKLTGFIKKLPFKLTNAQERVLKEIIADLKSSQPMNRLLQGEVGSGKTVIAAIAAFLAHTNNLRTIIMAPTEILAFQHYETLSKLLGPLGIEIGIYTGSKKAVSRQPSAISNVIVGTHALLSSKLELDNVGLVIIDEQQRFGVEHRSILRSKSKSPHFLTMTATPIPRTVALTLYGDLDLSIIDQMPLGRKVVRTHFVPHVKRADAYKFISNLVEQGQQAYIITPLIEESETLISAKAAKVEYEKLQKDIFPNLRLGLLHGRLKSKEKEAAINQFKNHEVDILVSTSVVEVGVDVPNATIMVIEGAERFGLAQLHQLRGRVGRGELQSFTFLFAETESPQVVNRLKNLEKIHDGLKLAELDLKIRGSGEIFGTLQSGQWNLKIADLSNLTLIESTKLAASKILGISPNLDKYPEIKAKLGVGLKEIMPD